MMRLGMVRASGEEEGGLRLGSFPLGHWEGEVCKRAQAGKKKVSQDEAVIVVLTGGERGIVRRGC